MKGFCPLASGSKGNAIYLGTEKTKILIDAGISVKDLTARLKAINVDLSEIEAVLITHEHGDHIRGLSALCSRLGIPVFANKELVCSGVKSDTLTPIDLACPWTMRYLTNRYIPLIHLHNPSLSPFHLHKNCKC